MGVEDEEQLDEVLQTRSSFEHFATSNKTIDQDFYDPEDGVIIKDFHKEWVESVEDNDRVAITAFTGSGKSSILGEMYPLWKVYREPGFDVLIVSDTLSQSTKTLSNIKHHIENSEYLKELKPDDRSSTWSKTEIELANGSTIYCKPYTEAVKGVHVDLVICDEAAEFDDHDIYRRYVRTRASRKNGTVCLISTPVHENDLMAKLSKGEDPENPKLSEKGYWNGQYPIEDEDGNPTFPEAFDEGDIENLRDEDPLMFQREYLCEALAVEGDLFDPNDVIECYDESYGFSEKAEDDARYYMGADFAVSKTGDYSVFTVIEDDPEKDGLLVRNMERVRGMKLNEQKNRIIQLDMIYDFNRIVVDETNFGQQLKQDLKDEGLPVKGQSFERKARNNLIVQLKTTIENQEIIFPRAERPEITRSLIDTFYNELLGFGRGETTSSNAVTYQSNAEHDDTVMSVAMALEAVEERRPVYTNIAY